MRIQSLLNTPTLLLFHDPECACLYATWYPTPSPQATLANYQAILAQVRQTRSQRLLNDCLLDENGWQEAAHWIEDNCFKQLAQAGLRTVAWVLPRQEEAMRDTQVLLQHTDGLLVDTFLDAESAYTWLRRW
ncbi:MAG: hypothetical protein EOO60_03960 [Hymenobacter sp.]|nr:MAG: hypothetical protein EOO60_03960 [Hymenobacter sp.]